MYYLGRMEYLTMDSFWYELVVQTVVLLRRQSIDAIYSLRIDNIEVKRYVHYSYPQA